MNGGLKATSLPKPFLMKPELKLITYEESEKTDKPSCLDAAYERKAIMAGMSRTAVFTENRKYLDMMENGCGWHGPKGVKYDNEKMRYDLLPPEAIEGAVAVFTMGAGKYGERNWEKGLKYGRIFAALMRHMWAWWRGEDIDPESGLSHLHHAACNVMMLQSFSANNRTDLDDRVKYENH